MASYKGSDGGTLWERVDRNGMELVAGAAKTNDDAKRFPGSRSRHELAAFGLTAPRHQDSPSAIVGPFYPIYSVLKEHLEFSTIHSH